MTEAELLLTLNATGRVGARIYDRLRAAFGGYEGIVGASAEGLESVSRVGPDLARAIRKSIDERAGEREREEADRRNIRVLTRAGEGYPEALRELPDAPLVLYVQGGIVPGDRVAIALVGSRRCTHYGRIQAERLGREIGEIGVTVVSGLARGVDTAAHKGALEGGGRTIAVLGSGLLKLYPRENTKLAERIAESGAVISEFPLHTGPERYHFPRRNRIISGLSLGVVVVEAALESGAMITVGHALDQGREVYAVPGRVDAPTSSGVHQLIREGAKLVESVEDILEELSEEARAVLAERPAVPTGKDAVLTGREKILLQLLGDEPRLLDELIGESGLPPSEVQAVLLSLELKHRVAALPGQRYARKAARAAGAPG